MLNSILNGFHHDPDALEFNQVLSATGFVSGGLVLYSSYDVKEGPYKPDPKG